jgi:hypothetical protein
VRQVRKDDDLGGAAQAEAPQGVEAGELRHLDVEQDAVGIVLPHLLQRDSPVLRHVDHTEVRVRLHDLGDQASH